MALVFWLGLSMGLIGSRTLIVYLIAISLYCQRLSGVGKGQVNHAYQTNWYDGFANFAWVLWCNLDF
jgi:hypothetical protein